MPSAPPFTAVLDRELGAVENVKALSALAIRDGNVVYERDSRTLYRIASISKLVTTIGVLRLAEAGTLSLDADIGTYLGYRVRNPRHPEVPVTLRMLLAHTSSLRDDAGYSWDASVDIKDVLQSQPAAWGPTKPGEYFSYANLPWGVAGTVMEKVTGERFDRLMKRLVIDPMGLAGGYNAAELSPRALANLATLYRKATAGDVQVWDPQGPWVAQVDDYSQRPPGPRAGPDYVPGRNGTLFAPQGGLRASVADLGRVMRMLMEGGALDGRRILRRETVDMMLTPQWTRGRGAGDADYGNNKGRFNAWALGNQVFMDVSRPGSGDRLVQAGGFRGNGHLGDAYGLYGTLVFDRGAKNGFVYLVGGTGFDPETQPGAYSAFARFEERIMTALHRRAILQRTD